MLLYSHRNCICVSESPQGRKPIPSAEICDSKVFVKSSSNGEGCVNGISGISSSILTDEVAGGLRIQDST